MTMTNSIKNTTLRHDGPVTKVGINGFGRIGEYILHLRRCLANDRAGRSVLRVALARSDIKSTSRLLLPFFKSLTRSPIVVAINHTAPTPEALLLALQYDSTHGRNPYFDQLSIVDDPSTGEKYLAFAEDRIVLSSERDPTKLTWDAWGAEYVLECTGKLTTIDAAKVHISVGGAKKVIISAPSKDAKTFVYGVNHGDYSSDMEVVSNASCTTNCLAPIAKVLDAVWGIEAGMLTTVHASTASQHLLDGFSKKNLRLGEFVI
jgi:glyceraldehyde 3-phosphate dehydrogenase